MEDDTSVPLANREAEAQNSALLQATTDCTLPALQLNTLSVRLNQYSAIPKFNITPVRTDDFRGKQEN